MPPPDVILFDWDNTLVDGWAAIQHGLNATFRHFAMPEWDRAQVLANVRRSLRESFPEMFGDRWEEARDVFYAGVRSCHLDVLRPMPGVPEMLEALAGLPLGVVSNKQGPLLRAEAAHLGWRFGALVGAGDAVADKPDAAPLLMALAAMGAAPGPGTWYVGDTALDMQAARAAGCLPVLLGHAAHDGGVAACAPGLHFPDAGALAAHVRALDKPAWNPDIRAAGRGGHVPRTR